MVRSRDHCWIICSLTTDRGLAWLLLFWGTFFAHSSPISSPERPRAPGPLDGRGGVLDPLLVEQNSVSDSNSLLETLKGQFLHTFNLTGIGSPVTPGRSSVEPPEYMLELYNRFATDRTAMPTANIVRSFKNEGTSLFVVAVLTLGIEQRNEHSDPVPDVTKTPPHTLSDQEEYDDILFSSTCPSRSTRESPRQSSDSTRWFRETATNMPVSIGKSPYMR